LAKGKNALSLCILYIKFNKNYGFMSYWPLALKYIYVNAERIEMPDPKRRFSAYRIGLQGAKKS
jgi:hypothetical protein